MIRHKISAALAVALVAAFALPSPSQASGEDVVCYFSSWARWRPGNGMFDVEDVDPYLCTHLVFSFTGLSNVTWELEVLDPWNELCPDEEGGYYCAFDRFVDLKKINPNLITMLAVGGWREGSVDYSVMAADPAKRKTFITSAIARILHHGFDGLDVDWEYPGSRGGAPEDKENFVKLMQEFRAEFDKFYPPLLLSSAVAAGISTLNLAYDIPKLVPLLDKWHIMAYDYHGAWENFTHHHAPLCGYPQDGDEFSTFYAAYTAQYYVDLGVPKDKMVLGIATYGRCYTLDDIDNHGMYAPTHAPGPPGPYIRLPGTLGFNEICEKLKEAGNDCEVVNDPSLNEPYFYCRSNKIWCSFDDGNSVYLKARYARNLGLAGVMVWQIDTDDFQPFCYNEKFHLIKEMKRGVQKPPGGDELVCPTLSTTTTSTTTTTATTITTTMPTTTTTTTVPTTTTTTTVPTTTTTTTVPTTTATTTVPTTTTTTTVPTTTTTTTVPTTTTTTIVPTTTTTTTVPTTTTTVPTTTTTTTTITTTTVDPGTTTTRDPSLRPDCTGLPDGTTFPHFDCNKYWVCISGIGILELCGPGTVWDQNHHICNWEENVDTSHCQQWVCSVDNIYYPHVDCDKYYWCYQGSPHLEQCPNGTYWSQEVTQCVDPAFADTSKCNIP